jgi:protein involved in polysaccharide export with SLBB domain
VTLAIVGEVSVTGRTPIQLEQDLLKLYSSQLVTKEVSVLVISSTYHVFVTGAVRSPGKILASRPLTVFEAIMEAGGYDSAKSDLKAIKVIRQEPGGIKNYALNLQQILDGKSNEQFYVRRGDTIYVPEKFSWF